MTLSPLIDSSINPSTLANAACCLMKYLEAPPPINFTVINMKINPKITTKVIQMDAVNMVTKTKITVKPV